MPAIQEQVGVVAVGNVFASDDGVGIRVLRRVRELVADERLRLIESERGGLDLLDCLEGLDAALVIDAGLGRVAPPGTVTSSDYSTPFAAARSPSLHTVDLTGLLAFGEATGMAMPGTVTLLSVEAGDIETFHEGCTPSVEKAIPGVVERVLREIQRFMPDVRVVSRRVPSASGS